MNNITSESKNLDLLKSILGQRLKEITFSDKDENHFWENCVLDFQNAKIEIRNSLDYVDFYEDKEELSQLSINYVEKFVSSVIDVKETTETINDIITSIEIIRDAINYKGKDDIAFSTRRDRAIIFKSDKFAYVFNNGHFFTEEMFYEKCNLNDYMKKIYSIEKTIEDWTYENKIAQVTREIIKI